MARLFTMLLLALGVLWVAPSMACATTGFTVTFSWPDVTNEDSYVVETGPTLTGPWTVFSLPQKDATSITDNNSGNGYPLGTNICHRVAGVNAFGTAPFKSKCGTATAPDEVTATTTVYSPH